MNSITHLLRWRTFSEETDTFLAYLRRHEQERLKPQFLFIFLSLLDPRSFKDDISQIPCSLPHVTSASSPSLSFPIGVPFCHGQRSVPVRGKNRWNHFRLPSQHFRPISSYALFFRISPLSLSLSLCASPTGLPLSANRSRQLVLNCDNKHVSISDWFPLVDPSWPRYVSDLVRTWPTYYISPSFAGSGG